MIWKRLRPILLAYDTEPLGLFAAVVTLLTGLWFLLPYDTFPASIAWRSLALLIAEPLFGAILVVVGLGGLAGLLLDGPRLLQASQFLTGMVWTFMATISFIANRLGTAPLLNLAIGLTAYWAFLGATRGGNEYRSNTGPRVGPPGSIGVGPGGGPGEDAQRLGQQKRGSRSATDQRGCRRPQSTDRG